MKIEQQRLIIRNEQLYEKTIGQANQIMDAAKLQFEIGRQAFGLKENAVREDFISSAPSYFKIGPNRMVVPSHLSWKPVEIVGSITIHEIPLGEILEIDVSGASKPLDRVRRLSLTSLGQQNLYQVEVSVEDGPDFELATTFQRGDQSAVKPPEFRITQSGLFTPEKNSWLEAGYAGQVLQIDFVDGQIHAQLSAHFYDEGTAYFAMSQDEVIEGIRKAFHFGRVIGYKERASVFFGE